jgi:hypothetical protein
VAYCTADQVKAALRLPAPDAQQVDQLDRAVIAVSAAIDRHCRRTFAETASISRVYTAISQGLVLTDDISSAAPVVEVRSSVTDSWTALASSNYQLEPLNNLSSGAYWPFTRIRALGGYTFPRADDGSALIRVTGTFGWTDVPTDVVEASILQCVRLFKRPDAPFGVTFGEFGAVSVPKSLDPDVAQMLEPYCLTTGPA